jgi:hypothetical protein
MGSTVCDEAPGARLATAGLVRVPDEIRIVSLADHLRDDQRAPGLVGACRNVRELTDAGPGVPAQAIELRAGDQSRDGDAPQPPALPPPEEPEIARSRTGRRDRTRVYWGSTEPQANLT